MAPELLDTVLRRIAPALIFILTCPQFDIYFKHDKKTDLRNQYRNDIHTYVYLMSGSNIFEVFMVMDVINGNA